jgi:hypothetical protein
MTVSMSQRKGFMQHPYAESSRRIAARLAEGKGFAEARVGAPIIAPPPILTPGGASAYITSTCMGP